MDRSTQVFEQLKLYIYEKPNSKKMCILKISHTILYILIKILICHLQFHSLEMMSCQHSL